MKISIKINAVLPHCKLCYFYNQRWNWYLFCLLQIRELWEKNWCWRKILLFKQQLLNPILLNLWMGQVKQIDIKNRIYDFFNDMINIEDLQKPDKNSY